jgi:hypothetical protein
MSFAFQGGFAFQRTGFAFQQEAGSVVTGQTPAGKPRKRRRYVVEIDGQEFLVESVQEATELLQRARSIAERQAEEKSERATKVLRKKAKVPEVRIAAPEIKVSPELRAELAPIVDDIRRLYRRAAEIAELRLLLLKEMRQEDDDEDDVLLLL